MQPLAFDTYAKSYDEHFTHSLVGKAQRAIVHRYLERHLSLNKAVLEINCGTGEDALFISERAATVLATDGSKGMIDVAYEKLDKKPNVKIQQLDIRDAADLPANTFDLVFSNFGGINCLNEENISDLAMALRKILRENGEAILVVMPEKCCWETTYYSAKLDLEKAFRRGNKSGVSVKLNNETFTTYYYSPARIKMLFKDYFATLAVLPVGFFIPPSYLNPFFEKRKKLFRFLNNLEQNSRYSFLSSYSDHYLIHLKKKS
jgi:SAM-dependent methyltransferase